MPMSKSQKLLFAFLTVIITVHAYVFYSLYVINGSTLMNVTGATSVIGAINQMGGVYMLGRYLPIWALVIIEFVCAYLCEILIGSPLSFKIASSRIDFSKTTGYAIEEEIIKATIAVMVPIMCFIASILYYPYYNGFNALTFLANWLKLICLNTPFAIATQFYFIQPIVRNLMKVIYKNR